MIARAAPSVVALTVALIISALVIALAGANPLLALAALVDGALGSGDGWSEVAVRTGPLLLTGLAVTTAFQAGIWNIGAEGQLLIGAIAAAWLGTHVAGAPSWLAIAAVLSAAALGGAIWAGIAGVLKTERGVDEVISTIMLNFLALGLVGYLVHGPLMESAGGYPQSDAIALSARLPRLVGGYRAHAGVFVAAAATCFAYVLLFRTKIGFAMRAGGLNPLAARLAGLPTTAAVLASLMTSGALAGIAGGIEVSAVTFKLYEQFSPGYGFTAIAVAMLGRLHPAGVVLAALLFGALDAGSAAMQRSAGVSAVLVSVIQATVIFSLLAVEGWRWRSGPTPATVARPPAGLTAGTQTL